MTPEQEIARWKRIARKASRLAERNGLALDHIEENDPQLVELAMDWANAEMRKLYPRETETTDRKEPVVVHGIPSRTGTDATAIGG